MNNESTKNNPLHSFARRENGGITAFGLFIFIVTLFLGGYAIDTSNAMRARTQLQVAADAAAHAALVVRELNTEEEAKAMALQIGRANMPVDLFGDVFNESSIDFGVWDPETRAFTPVAGSRSAVRVWSSRDTNTGNAVRTYLMGMVGVDQFNIRRQSVLETYIPTCFREGFVAESVVDMQSNNSFTNGFCIHSNDHVAFNQNNYFESGTVVSMPNPDDIQLPNSGFEKNEGLYEALRSGAYNIRILSRIEDIIYGLENFDAAYMPDYITGAGIVTLSGNQVNALDIRKGRVHRQVCGGSGTMTIGQDVVLRELVIVTDCEVRFRQGVIMEDAIIATTNTSARSFYSSAGLQVGRNDNCAPGGGAQLVTMGGMEFPAKLQIYGSQLLALGNVEFAAEADGIMGASVVAGGRIDGTSNSNFGFCGSGMENNFQADYFRLVL